MSSKDGDKAAETPAAAAEPTDEVPAEAAGAGEEEDSASSEAVSLLQRRRPLRRGVLSDQGGLEAPRLLGPHCWSGGVWRRATL